MPKRKRRLTQKGRQRPPQDDEDNFRQQPDWHPPGKAEDRIDQLFKVHTDQLPHPPSFISIHSGREYRPHSRCDPSQSSSDSSLSLVVQ